MMKTKILLAGLVLATLPCMAERPNVLVIMTDDQGYGEIGAHGHPFLKTPNMDRLHNESVRLVDFHVTPMCTPTRGALMTGQDPLRNRASFIAGQRMAMDRETPTMANYFSDAGYRTGLFGKWHLGDVFPHRPMDRGFQKTVTFAGAHVGSLGDYWLNDYFDDSYRVDGEAQSFTGYVQNVFCNETVKFMKTSRAEGNPFLAVHWTPLPHIPYYATAEKRARFEKMDNLNADQAGHFAMIEEIDKGIGALLDYLDESGLAENTIVVFLSDNGGTLGVPFFNAGMKGTKITYYEGGHRVHGFIRWPDGGLAGGREVDGLSSVTDLLPTLLELAGIPFDPKPFDGMSIAKNLKIGVPIDPDRSLVIVYGSFNTQPMGKERCEEGVVLWKDWRLVGASLREEAGFDELYNLSNDPGQTENLINQAPEMVQKLRGIYDQWWAQKSSGFGKWERYVVGDPACPILELSVQEASLVNLTHQKEVREGVRNLGVWKLTAEQSGVYRFRLRRYPKEADLAINAAAPEYKARDHHDSSRNADEFQTGRGLMANRVQFSIDGKVYMAEVPKGAKSVDITAPLNAGDFELSQAMFLNPMKQPAAAVFYLEIEWVGKK